jgi:glutamyl-tRNA reductase
MTEKNSEAFFCLSFSARAGHSASKREIARLSEEALGLTLDNWLHEFRKTQAQASLLYLSTCHRVEIYAYLIDPEALKDLWRQAGCSIVGEAQIYQSEAALEQFIRVASSLESEVLGETQITGQFKEAFKKAQEEDWLRGACLKLCSEALGVAKRIRTECFAHLGTVSIAHVAVDGSDDFFEKFHDKKALVVGAGPMAKQALERLRTKGFSQISWMNRSAERIEAEARRLSLQTLPFKELHRRVWEHDITVLATRSSTSILDRERLASERSLHALNGPKVLLDLGLPRNVDPQVHGFSGFYLRNVDAFNNLAQFNEKKRKEYVVLAEKILWAEKQRLLLLLDKEKTKTLLQELMDVVETRKREDAERFLVENNPKIEYITTKIYSNLLHGILKELEKLDDEESKQVLDTLIAAWRRSNRWQKRKVPEKSLAKTSLDP